MKSIMSARPDRSSMYHDYMAKNLADRYANLNSQMDNVIKDANSEISGLRDKLEREFANRLKTSCNH